jgi:septum formation protein
MSARPLILASSSRYRQELLRRLAIPFQSIKPDIDEGSYHSASESPEQLASLLAKVKASIVFDQQPQAVVIGSDQLIDLDGRVLGKPGTSDAAIAQMRAMSGRSHRLLTAVCVITPGGPVEFLNETRMQMRALTGAEMERYVAHDRPLDCAGSYRIESLGIGLFENIQTDDFTAIMGLPLIRLAQILRDLGYTVP